MSLKCDFGVDSFALILELKQPSVSLWSRAGSKADQPLVAGCLKTTKYRGQFPDTFQKNYSICTCVPASLRCVCVRVRVCVRACAHACGGSMNLYSSLKWTYASEVQIAAARRRTCFFNLSYQRCKQSRNGYGTPYDPYTHLCARSFLFNNSLTGTLPESLGSTSLIEL